MTGWGQDGPWTDNAGHDINYIAISGALDSIGTAQKPLAPLNLVGDFGGGALYLAFGLLAAILHARKTGEGQVVDAAMSDGAASMMAMFYGFKAAGMISGGRRRNLLDGGAHFYDSYACADGKWVAVGAIEPQFYAVLLERLGISDRDFDAQMDRSRWPALKERIAAIFATRTQAEWCAIMEGADACFAPILDMDEAPLHPHNRARGTFTELEGVVQPAPAPRFSRTPGAVQGAPPAAGAHNEEALLDWGFSAAEIEDLAASGVL
jgi:alpha-methylacyl-CoA racemase